MTDFSFYLYKKELNDFNRKLLNDVNGGSLATERNQVMSGIIESILAQPKYWDECAKVSALHIGDRLIDRIRESLNNLSAEGLLLSDAVDEIFSLLFRFSLELDFSGHADSNIESKIERMKVFVRNNKNDLSPVARSQIDYAQNSLPIEIVKAVLKTKDLLGVAQLIEMLDDLNKKKDEIQSEKSEWDKYIKDKEKEVNKLKDALDLYKNAYNFVGLDKGFSELFNTKKVEKRFSLSMIVFLGTLVFVPLVYEVYSSFLTGIKYTGFYDFLTLIPIFSITLILIYYFRVALQNHNSIKAQLSQIELRRALCQFIDAYGEYAYKMKKNDPDSLAKFENIIFSSIITNGDKIPPTFDGLDQIFKLIGELKKTS